MPRFYLWIGIALACLMASCAPRTDTLTIHFIRSNEGNATLLPGPGQKDVLVDAADLVGGYDVAQYLKQEKVGTLDYLVLTHPHVDHFGGVFFIARMFTVNNILDSGQDGGDLVRTTHPWGYYYNYFRIARKHKHYRAIKQGDSFQSGDITFKVLWPPAAPYAGSVNDNSVVLMAEYGKLRCLLTSDITANVERELVRRYGDELRADILQVSHHGSIDASSEGFLEAVRPRVAVIPAPKNFASSKVLKRLKEICPRVFLNTDGDVVVSATRNGSYDVRQ